MTPVTESPVRWELSLKVRDKKQLAKVLKECYDQDGLEFEWEPVVEDCTQGVILTMRSSWVQNLQDMVDKLAKEKGWD